MSVWDSWTQHLASLLSDRFEFVEFLGKGGFAAVYKVRSRTLGRMEALKVLLETRSDDSDYGNRFQQEARLAASLDHPNIIRIYDFGQVEDYFWYSMQFVDGPTVTAELQRKGPMDELTAARLSIPLLDAFEYSHSRGVVHRDIKPDNLILDGRGHPYVMDFGIAKTADSLVRTKSGFVLGSPAFLSPEQLRGETLDGRSDVYSFGITLYQMLSNERPFDASDPSTMLMKRLKEDPEPLAKKRPGIDPRMEAIVMRALARDRAGRYAAARDMRDELKGYLLEEIASSTGGDRNRRLGGTGPHLETFVAMDTGPTLEPADQRAVTRAMAETAPTTQVPRTASTRAALSAPEPASVPSSYPGFRTRALFAGALVVALAGAVFLVRSLRQGGSAHPTLPTAPPALPTGVPALPTAAATAPTAVPAPKPTAQPVKQANAPPLRIQVPRREEEAVPPPRRAATPPMIEEEVSVKLPADIAGEYANKIVGFSVIVATDGSVKSFRCVSPSDPPCKQCDEAAGEAVKKFRFKPARDASGNPVEAKAGVSIRF